MMLWSIILFTINKTEINEFELHSTVCQFVYCVYLYTLYTVHCTLDTYYLLWVQTDYNRQRSLLLHFACKSIKENLSNTIHSVDGWDSDLSKWLCCAGSGYMMYIVLQRYCIEWNEKIFWWFNGPQISNIMNLIWMFLKVNEEWEWEWECEKYPKIVVYYSMINQQAQHWWVLK